MRFAGFLRANEFNGLHWAKSANVADERRFFGPGLQSLLNHSAKLFCLGQQIALLKRIKNSKCRGAAERVAAEGPADAADDRCIHDLGASGLSSNRKSTTE